MLKTTKQYTVEITNLKKEKERIEEQKETISQHLEKERE